MGFVMRDWPKAVFIILIFLSAIGYGSFMVFTAVFDTELNLINKLVITTYTSLGVIASSILVRNSLQGLSVDLKDQ